MSSYLLTFRLLHFPCEVEACYNRKDTVLTANGMKCIPELCGYYS